MYIHIYDKVTLAGHGQGAVIAHLLSMQPSASGKPDPDNASTTIANLKFYAFAACSELPPDLSTMITIHCLIKCLKEIK